MSTQTETVSLMRCDWHSGENSAGESSLGLGRNCGVVDELALSGKWGWFIMLAC